MKSAEGGFDSSQLTLVFGDILFHLGDVLLAVLEVLLEPVDFHLQTLIFGYGFLQLLCERERGTNAG